VRRLWWIGIRICQGMGRSAPAFRSPDRLVADVRSIRGALQPGGALGVAVLGSLLATRYSSKMAAALAPYHVAPAITHRILGDVGSALAIASRVGGALGEQLAHVARAAFVSGMDLGLSVGAAVAVVGCVVALIALPRKRSGPDQ
jgi:hypothetical protein